MSIVDKISADHQQMYLLFNEFESALSRNVTGEQLRNIGFEIIRALSVHSFAEKEALYPALKKVEGGEEMANKALNEHSVLDKMLYQADQAKEINSDYIQNMNHIIQEAREHMTDEEQSNLPYLQKNSKDDDLRKMADAYEKSKSRAPTRPHPSAPVTPPFSTMAGIITKPIDKLKDKSRFADEQQHDQQQQPHDPRQYDQQHDRQCQQQFDKQYQQQHDKQYQQQQQEPQEVTYIAEAIPVVGVGSGFASYTPGPSASPPIAPLDPNTPKNTHIL